MTAQIYVLDTETTGLEGAPKDVVVEIGIARVDLDREKVYPEYSRIINAPLSEAQRSSWVFQNTDLTPEDCLSSPYFTGDVAHELAYLYAFKTFTAYNVAYDFGMFLDHDPWNFKPILAPCIMDECAERYSEDGRWFSAQAAYNLLCPDNPTKLPGGREEHRAMSDAIFEGHILLALCDKNLDIRDRYIETIEGAWRK